MDFITNNWQSIVGTIITIAGLGWLPFTRTLLLKGLKVVMSEAFLKALFFDLAGKYVASTKTTLDDKFLEELEKSFNGS